MPKSLPLRKKEACGSGPCAGLLLLFSYPGLDGTHGREKRKIIQVSYSATPF